MGTRSQGTISGAAAVEKVLRAKQGDPATIVGLKGLDVVFAKLVEAVKDVCIYHHSPCYCPPCHLLSRPLLHSVLLSCLYMYTLPLTRQLLAVILIARLYMSFASADPEGG